MNSQELYQKAENARRDATPVHQRSIDEIITAHMALQARVAELEGENRRLREAIMSMDTCAHMLRERTTIDPHKVSHAHLAEMYALTMQISRIAADALKAGADHE